MTKYFNFLQIFFILILHEQNIWMYSLRCDTCLRSAFFYLQKNEFIIRIKTENQILIWNLWKWAKTDTIILNEIFASMQNIVYLIDLNIVWISFIHKKGNFYICFHLFLFLPKNKNNKKKYSLKIVSLRIQTMYVLFYCWPIVCVCVSSYGLPQYLFTVYNNSNILQYAQWSARQKPFKMTR